VPACIGDGAHNQCTPVRCYSIHISRSRTSRNGCSSSSCSRQLSTSELRYLLVSAMEHTPSAHRCVDIRS